MPHVVNLYHGRWALTSEALGPGICCSRASSIELRSDDGQLSEVNPTEVFRQLCGASPTDYRQEYLR
jgi:hypothetical protein